MNDVFPKSLTVKQALLSTFAFFDLFNAALTRKEISDYYFRAPRDESKIDIYLRESPLIDYRNGFFALKKDEAFWEDFEKREKLRKKFWKKVNRYRFLFNLCPFIKFVGVCNSLPMKSLKPSSDIDLFVVCKRGHLFTARIFLTLLTSLFGVRRTSRKSKKRFCLSFYVCETDLHFESLLLKPLDIYFAYWLKSMEPLCGEYYLYLQLLENNRGWMSEYFNELAPKHEHFKTARAFTLRMKNFLERRFLHPKWEYRFEKWQLERALKKAEKLTDKSGTVISKTMLKFHNVDRRSEIQNAWLSRIRSVS